MKMKKTIVALGVASMASVVAFNVNAQSSGNLPLDVLLKSGETPFISNKEAPEKVRADQLQVNAGGIGHIMLTPYYTTQESKNTLLNIVNTDTANGKVVKIRFRGARNSDDVFDFYVFLSPGDVWRSRVYNKGDETFLDIPDNSCTLPSRDVVISTAFKADRLYNSDINEAREGYIELLNAADVPKGSKLYDTIKHNIKGEVECDIMKLVDATQRNTTLNNAIDKGLYFPSGGLMGHWAIVDVVKNTTVSGNNVAIEAVKDGMPALANIIVSPQDRMPVPSSWLAGPTAATADPLLTNGRVQALNFDFPDLSTPYVEQKVLRAPATNPASHQANQISEALSVTNVMNEFATHQGVDLKTDWVFSMPTRRYGVAIDYDAKGGEMFVSNPENAFFGKDNVRMARGAIPQLETSFDVRYYDDNERSLMPEVSPMRTSTLSGEVNVLTFNNKVEESVLDAKISTKSVYPKFNNEAIHSGWAYVNMQNARAEKYGFTGVPVVGFAALTAGEQALGFTWPHKFKN